jgi:hypothetical protein
VSLFCSGQRPGSLERALENPRFLRQQRRGIREVFACCDRRHTARPPCFPRLLQPLREHDCSRRRRQLCARRFTWLDTCSLTWSQPKLPAPMPPAKALQMSLVGDHLIVFGGEDRAYQPCNTATIFHVGHSQTAPFTVSPPLLPLTGEPPFPRHSHAGSGLGGLVIWGGQGDHFYGDLWLAVEDAEEKRASPHFTFSSLHYRFIMRVCRRAKPQRKFNGEASATLNNSLTLLFIQSWQDLALPAASWIPRLKSAVAWHHG